MNESVLMELAKNGPWAAGFAFLLWTVIKAWNTDRDRVTMLLGEFNTTLLGIRGALDSLKSAVDQLNDRLEEVEKGTGARPPKS